VLARRPSWEPLLGWLRDFALPAGKISAAELDLLALADDEAEICELLGRAARRI